MIKLNTWQRCIIIIVFAVGFLTVGASGGRLFFPRPSPKAQDSAQDSAPRLKAPKVPPHPVKVTIKYNKLPTDGCDELSNLVDTEYGNRCVLRYYWGEPGDTFYVSSDKLFHYVPTPEKEMFDINSIPLSTKNKENEP